MAWTCAGTLLTGAPFVLDWFPLGKHYSLKYGYALIYTFIRHHLETCWGSDRGLEEKFDMKWEGLWIPDKIQVSHQLCFQAAVKAPNRTRHQTRATNPGWVRVVNKEACIYIYIYSVCAWNNTETIHHKLHAPPPNKRTVKFHQAGGGGPIRPGSAPHLLQPVYLWPPEPHSLCINFPQQKSIGPGSGRRRKALVITAGRTHPLTGSIRLFL